MWPSSLPSFFVATCHELQCEASSQGSPFRLTSLFIDNYIFHENSRKVDEHFSLFFVKISQKLRRHFLVIFRENMVHNKIKNIDYFVRRSTYRLLNVVFN